MELERVTLFFRESRALVEVWCSEECVALGELVVRCIFYLWVSYGQTGLLRPRRR
jgi:hypothetical protein